MENNTADAIREKLNFTLEEMHTHQVQEASHYRMVIMRWGEDEGDNATGAGPYSGSEGKLHSILKAIKQNSPTTTTIAYCGQFENVVPFYDAQARIIKDKAYAGFFLKDDRGNFWSGASAGGQGGRMWDFRNAGARQYLADYVAG